MRTSDLNGAEGPGRFLPRSLTLAAAAAMLFSTTTGRAGEPAGIYGLLPSYNSEQRVDLAKRPLWNNPALQGVTVRTVWKNLQPTGSAVDWSFFDEAVRLAANHGKKAGLSLVAGIFTPKWVYANGVQPFDFTLQGPWRPTTAAVMPEPWDPAFQRVWGSVVAAMGRKYDGDPNVAYVMVGGVGFSIESFYVKTPEDTAKLRALGGPEIWLRGSEQVIDLYAAAFPHKPFILAMAPPIRGAIGATWLRRLVEYGMHRYPGRFGVMYHGLNAVADTAVYQNAAVQEFAGVSPTGFQMIWSTEGEEGQQRVRGSLDQALDRAVDLKAHWVEVYEADCENPAYQNELKSAGQQLLRNASAR